MRATFTCNRCSTTIRVQFVIFILLTYLECCILILFKMESTSECPQLPPALGHLCPSPAGGKDCHYDDGNGGSEQLPFVSNCCCGRCDTDTITCQPDSITGAGLWQSKLSMLCPADGCGTDAGEWRRHNWHSDPLTGFNLKRRHCLLAQLP